MSNSTNAIQELMMFLYLRSLMLLHPEITGNNMSGPLWAMCSPNELSPSRKIKKFLVETMYVFLQSIVYLVIICAVYLAESV